jgi:hypothetical protein
VLLASQTVSTAVATVSFFTAGMTNGGFGNTTFDEFEIHLVGVTVDTSAVIPGLQCSTDGSTFDATTNYGYATANAYDGSAGGFGNVVNIAYGSVFGGNGLSNAAYATANGIIRLFRPWASGPAKLMLSDMAYFNSGGSGSRVAATVRYYAGLPTIVPVVGLRFMLASAGNYTKGTFRIWGIQN